MPEQAGYATIKSAYYLHIDCGHLIHWVTYRNKNYVMAIEWL